MMRRGLEEYLAVRRALGFGLRNEEYLLRAFLRFARRRRQSSIRRDTALEWARSATSATMRWRRFATVKRLAEHLRIADPRHESLGENVFIPGPKRVRPYIFDPGEVGAVVAEAARLRPGRGCAGWLRPHVYETLFALLGVTGLRVREALRLQIADVAPDGLVVRETKFRKSRLVPLHPTAAAALSRYLELRRETMTKCDALFVSAPGRRLSYNAVHANFLGITERLGLRPPRGRAKPRIHDLRHTFAVRALEGGPAGRDQVTGHMVALATYLGHSNISDTYYYLHATPNLLRNIADVCEAKLDLVPR